MLVRVNHRLYFFFFFFFRTNSSTDAIGEGQRMLFHIRLIVLLTGFIDQPTPAPTPMPTTNGNHDDNVVANCHFVINLFSLCSTQRRRRCRLRARQRPCRQAALSLVTLRHTHPHTRKTCCYTVWLRKMNRCSMLVAPRLATPVPTPAPTPLPIDTTEALVATTATAITGVSTSWFVFLFEI